MVKFNPIELKEFLEEKVDKYNRFDFIESDPISIPHQFTKKEDIEIAGFLSATIAWGQRITIINNANKLMKLMGNSPFDFVMNAKEKDFIRFSDFKHRTFNGIDAVFFLRSLQNIYRHHGGLQNVFGFGAKRTSKNEINLLSSITGFRDVFFSISHPARTGKHVSNPSENSSSKRLCMYLRWMVRNDKRNIDFGLWANTSAHTGKRKDLILKNDLPLSAYLMCPLDIHSGNVARKLGLLSRTQNDWKAVEELTNNLKKFDPVDPVKYDFALFGLGVFEKF
ncbi:MAG: TIGR02757 family protein [Bacteroidota bacterium]